jgi:SAM-dependent methyltransferase
MVQAVQLGFPLARRMIDVGCGTGTFLASFRQAGFDVVGVEYSARLRARCARKGLVVHPFDLSQGTLPPPGAPFDFALSTEVAEHIPPQYADAMVAYLCQLSDVIVFTAAPPGQGGTGHVNEQPRQYWIEKFAAHGMVLNEPTTAAMAGHLQSSPALQFLHGNLSVFRRQSKAPVS